MAQKILEKTKLKQKRGSGYGASYKPWINTNEFPGHLGVHHNLVDWKTGRQLQLLSDGELWQYLILRWNDEVTDIREQYPLDTEVTSVLYEDYSKFHHPSDKNGLLHMTSDLLVDYADRHQEVYSVKASRDELLKTGKKTENMIIRLTVEKRYWTGRDVKWHLVFKEDMNRAYAENISSVIYYWKPSEVVDKVSLFKFLVAHKQIVIDMESHAIDALEFFELANDFIKDDDVSVLISSLQTLRLSYEDES